MARPQPVPETRGEHAQACGGPRAHAGPARPLRQPIAMADAAPAATLLLLWPRGRPEMPAMSLLRCAPVVLVVTLAACQRTAPPPAPSPAAATASRTAQADTV